MNIKLWKAFLAQRQYTKVRVDANGDPIEWDFTYAMWELKWVLSGKLHLRGGYRYVMSRPNDTGPYSFYNTEIITHAQNVSDGKGSRGHISTRRKPCSVKDVDYESRDAASIANGVSDTTIKDWINAGKYNSRWL